MRTVRFRCPIKPIKAIKAVSYFSGIDFRMIEKPLDMPCTE
jgi:hypothetical protein